MYCPCDRCEYDYSKKDNISEECETCEFEEALRKIYDTTCLLQETIKNTERDRGFTESILQREYFKGYKDGLYRATEIINEEE